MLHATLPVLFESSDNTAVLADPTNEDWISVVSAIDGRRYDVLARRYYQALYHFRSQRKRPALPGTVEVVADSRQQALEGMLDIIEQRKTRRKQAGDNATSMFVDAQPDETDETLPASLRDVVVSSPTVERHP